MTASGTTSLNAAEHPVKSVTIFQSSTAQITRTFSVELKVRLIVLIMYLYSLILAKS